MQSASAVLFAGMFGLVLRTGANFDRPYKGETAYDSLVVATSHGFTLATANLYNAGWPLVQAIVSHWDQWSVGIPAQQASR